MAMDEPRRFFRPRLGEATSDVAKRVRTSLASPGRQDSSEWQATRSFDPSADDFDIDDWRDTEGRDLWTVGAEWGYITAFIVRNLLVIRDDCAERYRAELDLPIDFAAQAKASFVHDEVGVDGPHLEITSDLLLIDTVREHFDPAFNEEVLFNGVVVAQNGQWQ